MDRNQPAGGMCPARAVRRLERAVVVAVLACIVVLAVIGLGFYGLKSRTGWLRVQAGVWRLVTFSIEVGQGDKPPLRELEAGHDKPRELEAGPSADAGQDSAPA